MLAAERASDWGIGGARLVDRGQLVDALDRAVTRRVTLISAPAGSGKTSLLRAWAARPFQTHQVAFVSVRRDQNDEQLFWLALLEAIRNTAGKSDADELLTATPSFNARAMGDRVLSDLGAGARCRRISRVFWPSCRRRCMPCCASAHNLSMSERSRASSTSR